MKTFQKQKYRYSRLPIILLIAILCYFWIVLCFSKADYLYQVQNFSPWMGTSDFLQLYIGYPGGLREWAGYWLTQFFFHPWMGATLLLICWGVSISLLVRAYYLTGWCTLFALVPVISLFASITDLGYWIFCLKTQSYWFGPTLGLLAVSIMQYAYSRSRNYGRFLLLALMILLGYPLLGWYATLGILSMLLSFPRRRSKSDWLKLFSITGVSWVIIWTLYYHSSQIHWRESFLLYGFHHVEIPEAQSFLLEVPFWVMAISIIGLPLFATIFKRPFAGWVAASFASLSLIGGNMLNYRNVNFHTELRMLRAMDEARWDDILQEIKTARRPTREMVIMKDVALAQMGQLGERAFDYPIGGIRPQMNIDLPIHMAHSAAPLFYYWLGIPNYAFMWCMENNIEYGLSPFYLRIMYRSMLVNGEQEAAEKYKKLLATTLFYKDYDVPVEETKNVRRFMTGHDELTNDRGYSEIYLLNRLSKESYNTPEAQQIAVHFAILARSRDSFMAALNRYQQLVMDKDSASVQLPKYFNQQTFDWYYDQETGNKSY